MKNVCVNDFSILIIGITKNGGNKLKKNISRLSKLEGCFKRLDFLIYENGSTDNTVKILNQIKQKKSNFNFVSESLTQDDINKICKTKTLDGKPCRIEIITYARNKLHKEAEKNCNNFDYILNMDLDILFQNPFDIIKTFERFSETEFDCITGCGLTKWLKYRDAYAFRSKEFPFGPEFLGEFWWKDTVHRIQKRYKKNQKIKVYSAFGGAAIYKKEAYFSSLYSCYPDGDFINEHQKLDFSKVDSLQIKNLNDSPVPNTGYTAPIICEHVPFHYGMRKAGFNKIFLDTSWRFIFRD